MLLAVTMPQGLHIYDLTRSASAPLATVTCSSDGYIASSAFAALLSQEGGSAVAKACLSCPAHEGSSGRFRA